MERQQRVFNDSETIDSVGPQEEGQLTCSISGSFSLPNSPCSARATADPIPVVVADCHCHGHRFIPNSSSISSSDLPKAHISILSEESVGHELTFRFGNDEKDENCPTNSDETHDKSESCPEVQPWSSDKVWYHQNEDKSNKDVAASTETHD